MGQGTLRVRWVHLVLLVVLVSAVAAPTAVWASHRFGDVADSIPFTMTSTGWPTPG